MSTVHEPQSPSEQTIFVPPVLTKPECAEIELDGPLEVGNGHNGARIPSRHGAAPQDLMEVIWTAAW